MIAIVNIGAIRKADPFGWHRYEVRINRAPVCRFRHKRSDGLAKCLERAMQAVSNKNYEKIAALMAAYDREHP